MVDIHAHILPGLDDGAVSLSEAVEMARMAAASGIHHMAATSHGNFYGYTLEEYGKSFDNLRKALKEEEIPLKLYPGMEIFLDETAFILLEKGELLSINETDYLLVEFAFDEDPGKVVNRIHRLQRRGNRVILAHPERYIFVQKDPELAYFLAEEGCLLQVNGGSILGDFGKNCNRLSRRFLEDGIAGLIASDSHDPQYRVPSATGICDCLEKYFPPEAVKLWMSENPSRILKGYPSLSLKKR